jgi:hypothetical protein
MTARKTKRSLVADGYDLKLELGKAEVWVQDQENGWSNIYVRLNKKRGRGRGLTVFRFGLCPGHEPKGGHWEKLKVVCPDVADFLNEDFRLGATG